MKVSSFSVTYSGCLLVVSGVCETGEGLRLRAVPGNMTDGGVLHTIIAQPLQHGEDACRIFSFIAALFRLRFAPFSLRCGIPESAVARPWPQVDLEQRPAIFHN
jgi:hypothetical protein